MKILLFAKERPGLNEVRTFLHSFGATVIEYNGGRGDPFPSAAIGQSSDLIISYLSPWIIPAVTLNAATLYPLNFHPAPPSYPGTGCTNFALYEEAAEYGVTAHIMDSTVDTGQIVGVKRFAILPTDTVATLLQRSYAYLLVLFYEVVTQIAQKKPLEGCGEVWTRKAFTRKELNALCEIRTEMSNEEIRRRVRATYYPGMPGPYVKLGGLTLSLQPL